MLRYVALCLAGLALTACVSVPRPAAESAQELQALWQQRLLELGSFSDWSIRGRVAVYAQDEVYNLGLGWQRQGDASRLKIEASLGQGVILVEKTAADVVLTMADGSLYRGFNAEQVLRETTGISIPVEGLQSWIKGIPRQDGEFKHDIDTEGRLSSLLQDGWRINYLDYQQSGQPPHLELPRRMYLKHEEVALKVVIDQWQNTPGPGQPSMFPVFPD